MANDDPTSLRMGFGGQQAYAAGVTGFRKPLAARFYDFATKERAAEKEIAALSKKYPFLKPRSHRFPSNEWRKITTHIKKSSFLWSARFRHNQSKAQPLAVERLFARSTRRLSRGQICKIVAPMLPRAGLANSQPS
jgi:hypothetical protein